MFAALKSSSYNKMDLPACFSSVFLGFQFTDLSKMPSFPRQSAFHSYFVVSSPHERLSILHVCGSVTCNLVPRPFFPIIEREGGGGKNGLVYIHCTGDSACGAI